MSRWACTTSEAEPRKTTLPVMPQGTAPGFPATPPPLPHGSEASTSGFGNYPEPAALGRPYWALFRSSAFALVFRETQLCSWTCQTGISWPLRVPVGQSAALKRRDLCSVEARSPRRAGRASALGREVGSRIRGPGADLLSFSDCSVPDACVSPPPHHGGYGSERPPRGGRSVYCSALFVLPLLGLHEAASFYQRALLANALTSALRLHQRLPHFQLSRAFLAQALLEDSCHYLLYSLIFVNSYPVTMVKEVCSSLLYIIDSLLFDIPLEEIHIVDLKARRKNSSDEHYAYANLSAQPHSPQLVRVRGGEDSRFPFRMYVTSAIRAARALKDVTISGFSEAACGGAGVEFRECSVYGVSWCRRRRGGSRRCPSGGLCPAIKAVLKKREYGPKYTQNNFITGVRAMNEFCLKSSDLEQLRKIRRRSPHEDTESFTVYLRSDVEANNGLNCFFKFLAWIYTGSASMFSEAIHSLSDTCNQGLLALGISNPLYDSLGSLGVGTLLGVVSAFLIYTNTEALLGRSIQPEQVQRLTELLENDPSVRAIHDVKATDLGLGKVRFKAEVDFDGRVVTRSYLEKQDFDQLLQEIQEVKTPEELETFMLKHGENIIDTLGAEVDRLERELKKRNPEVRHVDLEIL
ncbi:hypothetical protein CB1_001596006 [Camelus ferus]|nr:hypothetical protein CB1_001596006 [Camelus ferus]